MVNMGPLTGPNMSWGSYSDQTLNLVLFFRFIMSQTESKNTRKPGTLLICKRRWKHQTAK